MCIRGIFILFHNDISPHLKGYIFVNFLIKIKRINNADKFSQPPLMKFTKGADILAMTVSVVTKSIVFVVQFIYFYSSTH